ncbi:MAG: hypothetical protein QM703_02820 [Gemmatales bacterium]
MLALLTALILLNSGERLSDDLESLVRAAQRSALAHIDTMHCRYEEINSKTTDLIEKGEYVHHQDAYYLKKMPAKGSVQEIWFSKLKKVCLITKGPGVRLATIASSNGIHDNYVFSRSLFSFYGPDSTRIVFDELLNKTHKLQFIRIDDSDRDLIHLKLSHVKAELEIWFDSKVNYLARRMKMTSISSEPKNAPQTWEMEVLAFKLIGNAVYFPEKVLTRSIQNEKLLYETITTFSAFGLQLDSSKNEVLSKILPAEIIVYDSIKGKAFITKGDGSLVERPDISMTNSGPLAVSSDKVKHEQTVENDTNWNKGLFYVSLALIVIGLSGYIIKRRVGTKS